MQENSNQIVTVEEHLISRGYSYRTFTLGKKNYAEFTAPNGWVWLTPRSFYDYPFISRTVRDLARDKQLSYALATSYDISVPQTIHTGNVAEASEFLSRFDKVIVKPLAESGSRGLTLDIDSPELLEDAIARATFGGNVPLIQEQFIGEELRFTVLKGEVRSVILRRSPRVIGDGVHTVAQLIDAENRERLKLSFPRIVYPQLSRDLLSLDDDVYEHIPAFSEIIELSKTTMIGRGASFYGVTHQVHRTYIELVERLSAKLNPAMLIVDLMVKDFTAPATDKSYIFLEFNTTPALRIYTSLRDGDQTDVIKMIADEIDDYAKNYYGHSERLKYHNA